MNDKFFKSKLNEIDTLQLRLVAKGDYLFKHIRQLTNKKLIKIVNETNELAKETIEKLQGMMTKEPTNLQFIEMSFRMQTILNLQNELIKFTSNLKKTSCFN